MSVFKDVEDTGSSIKVLIYGATGSGKSMFGLTAPKVFAFDSEQGLNFYKKNPNLIKLAPTSSIYDMQDGIDEIQLLLDKDANALKTVVLDSETKFYNNLQDISLTVEEKRMREKGKDIDDTNLSVRSWGRIKSMTNRFQSMKIDLASRGINVISIAHEVDIKKKVGDEYVIIGQKPDVYKNLQFDYDVVLRFYTDTDKKGVEHYYAKVVKDRTSNFIKGAVIENPVFDMWIDKMTDTVIKSQTNYSSDTNKDELTMVKEDRDIEAKTKISKALVKTIEKISAKGKVECIETIELYNVTLKTLTDLDLKQLTELKIKLVIIIKSDIELNK
jgi:hypothetical protein